VGSSDAAVDVRTRDNPAHGGAPLIPKVEGPSLASSKDRFQSIYNALGEM
jgi:hypothetical protein